MMVNLNKVNQPTSGGREYIVRTVKTIEKLGLDHRMEVSAHRVEVLGADGDIRTVTVSHTPGALHGVDAAELAERLGTSSDLTLLWV